MTRCKFEVAAVLAFMLLGTFAAFGQRANAVPDLAGSGRAQGTLTVTMTVASSVGIVTGSDGQQRIVVANAVAASDNVSSLRYVRLTDVNGPHWQRVPEQPEIFRGRRQVILSLRSKPL